MTPAARALIPALALGFALSPVAAGAAVVTVTGGTGLPSATSWGVIASENTGGGSAAITGTAPRDTNGSVEMRGDRARFQLGIQYAGAFQTNLGALSNVLGLSFDWRIAGDSVTNPGLTRAQDVTPALRLLVQDGSKRSELIWEGAYNGTYGNTNRDQWYSSSFADNFYQFVAGMGVTTSGGSQVNKTLQSWIADSYSTSAFVSGISVGVGSSFASTYHAFADNVVFATTAGSTTYDFELAATAVPEPGTMALLLAGTGALALTRRRRAAHPPG